ncbi:MAG: hypothetical protein SFU57_11745 [Gemmatimonadales bacterium]|nr:hypothetical protein [Gemmatimonadales bacterium]
MTTIEGRDTMHQTRLYCSACDREVRVVISEALAHDGQASLHDEEVVCLELGGHCTGNMCPVGAVAPREMVARLARNGLPTDGLRTLTAPCPTCGAEVEMVLYGNGKAACTVCGSEARWVVDHLEPSP